MAKALSVDLRRRVVNAITRSLVPPGGAEIWGERVERDLLA
jgi:hypothetical protein